MTYLLAAIVFATAAIVLVDCWLLLRSERVRGIRGESYRRPQ